MNSPHAVLGTARCARARDNRAGTPRGLRQEEGSIAPLIIGFVLILGVLVGVVVDASAAYLRRQGLDNVADAAALAATDGLQGQEVYTGGLGKRAQIDPATARQYVEQYLASSGARSSYPGLAVQVVTRGDRVEVHLTAPVDLPFGVPGVARRTTVTGDAASEVLIGD